MSLLLICHLSFLNLFKKQTVRVGINTRFLLANGLEGIGVYTKEISKMMVHSNPDVDFVFFFYRPYYSKFIFANNVTPVVVSPPARHPFLWKMWFDGSLPFFLKKHEIDVFFSPDSYVSLVTDVHQLVTIHDLAFEHFPEGIGWLKRKYYQYYMPKFANKASHIFAVSDYTKSDLMKTYGVVESCLSVSYNGVDDIKFKPASNDVILTLKESYTNGSDYFLYVGAQHPRKNIINLLLAFQQFKSESKSLTKLILVGREAWGNQEMKRIYDGHEFKADIIFTGRVSDEELIGLYSGATALTYIPFFEGFGIPIIEAHATGTCVITSNISSMPEVLGGGGVLVDPNNIQQISSAMRSLDFDVRLRESYEKLGFQNAKRFSWKTSAELIMSQLRKHIG